MHADVNIRYANYQREDQMSKYIIDIGFSSNISEITPLNLSKRKGTN